VSSSEVPCEHCKAPAVFTTQVPPLGDDSGHRVYQCSTCERFTWVPWSGWHSEVRQPDSPVIHQHQQQQQQLQQQQPQPKKDEPKE
jgi:hypothetical protein